MPIVETTAGAALPSRREGACLMSRTAVQRIAFFLILALTLRVALTGGV